MAALIRAVEVLSPGKWPPESAVDRLALTFDDRYRRRLRYVALGGTAFLLDLPRTTLLRAGDGLRLEDGRVIAVEALPEQLAQITAPDTATLMRLAWHIGNRHLPAQLEPTRILIRDDAVIVNMLVGQGATVRHIEEPFNPEPGAYDANTTQAAHGHTHGGHGHGGHSHGG
jgi:urease accessory protein